MISSPDTDDDQLEASPASDGGHSSDLIDMEEPAGGGNGHGEGEGKREFREEAMQALLSATSSVNAGSYSSSNATVMINMNGSAPVDNTSNMSVDNHPNNSTRTTGYVSATGTHSGHAVMNNALPAPVYNIASGGGNNLAAMSGFGWSSRHDGNNAIVSHTEEFSNCNAVSNASISRFDNRDLVSYRGGYGDNKVEAFNLQQLQSNNSNSFSSHGTVMNDAASYTKHNKDKLNTNTKQQQSNASADINEESLQVLDINNGLMSASGAQPQQSYASHSQYYSVNREEDNNVLRHTHNNDNRNLSSGQSIEQLGYVTRHHPNPVSRAAADRHPMNITQPNNNNNNISQTLSLSLSPPQYSKRSNVKNVSSGKGRRYRHNPNSLHATGKYPGEEEETLEVIQHEDNELITSQLILTNPV